MASECLDPSRKVFRDATAWRYARALRLRGNSLFRTGAYARSEADLLEAYDVYAESIGADDMRTSSCVRDLADLYTLWNRDEPDAGHGEAEQLWRSRRR